MRFLNMCGLKHLANKGLRTTEAYLKRSQKSMMELFCKNS